ELDERRRAVGNQPPDDVFPADGRRHLADERLDRIGGRPFRLRIDVGDDRHRRILRRERAQLRRQTLFGGFHQRAMEGPAARARGPSLRPAPLRALSAPPYAPPVPPAPPPAPPPV